MGEIELLWRACDTFGYPFGDYCKLLLVTGQRRNEVATAKWSDIDLSRGQWTQTDNKADRTHVVPLSELALSIISSLPKFKASELLFTSTGKTHIQGQSKLKKRLDEKVRSLINEEELKGLYVEPWQLHDLRRTFTTHLRRMGVGQDICARLLNHAEKGVTAEHYDQYDMLEEKTRAMNTWGAFLKRILEGKQDNVVDIKQV